MSYNFEAHRRCIYFVTKKSVEIFQLSGLVDALADPRAYLSTQEEQEKRKDALHNMGVDDSDIVEVVATHGANASGKQRAVPTQRLEMRHKLNGALQSPATE